MGSIIKFPVEGRIVRFGRDAADESATIIILPVVRVERYADPYAAEAALNRNRDFSGLKVGDDAAVTTIL